MREILFRAWSKSYNKWVYGYYVNKNNVHIIKEMKGSLTFTIDNPKTVSQYIGLDDKNGKRIFEGDKLDGAIFGKVTVVWDNSKCAFVPKWHNRQRQESIGYLRHMEIIGNIYNKEATNA
jgi:hypothetical protein